MEMNVVTAVAVRRRPAKVARALVATLVYLLVLLGFFELVYGLLQSVYPDGALGYLQDMGALLDNVLTSGGRL